jgi:DNA-binding GntR family transcriptional regulator
MAAVIEEHEKVLRAIERSDPQAASAAMMAHLDSVLPAIQQIEAQAKLDALAGNK